MSVDRVFVGQLGVTEAQPAFLELGQIAGAYGTVREALGANAVVRAGRLAYGSARGELGASVAVRVRRTAYATAGGSAGAGASLHVRRIAYATASATAGARVVVRAHRTYGPVVTGGVATAGMAGVIPAPARA